jgi:hypothetical protein
MMLDMRCAHTVVAGLLALAVGIASGHAAAPAPTVVATPASPQVIAELSSAVEQARGRFEARDAAGVLAWVSDRYRSSGVTKAGVREQLNAMFALYTQLKARVTVTRVAMVQGDAWVYTTGEITGRVPVLGWVTVLSWEAEPEVARREATGWRLFGFQD